jgi:glycosyltransferase involved in cell wall biosynthesis
MRELPEVALVVGGDGELRSQYQGQANAMLGSRAVFLGDVSDEDLPKYYSAADVVVLPSVDGTEAFGLVLIEAMACGTPVVASRLPGVRTLVEEGRNGYLVHPGNKDELAEKIGRAIREHDELGAAARAFCTKYDWENVTQRLRDVYEKIV